ncbi:MAG: tRNA-dihydrouridine synthase [Candidatus Hodarchaeales archaeon]
MNRNPSMLSAMAGVTDGEFANYCLNEGKAGHVTIGGYSIGKKMIEASNLIMSRGREEFKVEYNKEIEVLSREIEKIGTPSSLFINLRFNSYEDAKRLANQLSKEHWGSRPIIEINAHCRQKEIAAVGGGEMLLTRKYDLNRIIAAFKAKDYRVSLKIRGNRVEPSKFLQEILINDIDFIHIDSYKLGKKGTDLNLLKEFTDRTDITIIGNNSIKDIKTANAVLEIGAQFFSIARAAKKDPLIFKKIIKYF